MKVFRLIIVMVMAVLPAACAVTPLRNIPLLWEPTAAPDFSKVDLSQVSNTAIRVEIFRDLRNQPLLIAENLEDAEPKLVTTRGDVGAFVSQHVRQMFDRAGLRTVSSGGAVVLSGEVRKFFVEETSTYKGTVALQMTLRSPSGAILWRGSSSGTAEHFGHSYTRENYYQTLSDALVNATSALVQNAQFRLALAKVSDGA